MNTTSNSSEQQHPVAQGVHFFVMLGAAAGACQHGFQPGVLAMYGIPAAIFGLALCGIVNASSSSREISASRMAVLQGTTMGRAISLFAFYWLFRAVCPEVLPETMQHHTWSQIIPACLIGGALFALPAALAVKLPATTAEPAAQPS